MISVTSWGASQHSFVFIIAMSAIGLLCYRAYKTKKSIRTLAGNWAADLVPHFSPTRMILKLILMGIGLLFLCIALLRPQGKSMENQVMQEGRNVYFALDISRSMLAQDVAPTRLACAKEKIKQIATRLTCEQVGLIVFSEFAHVQCPLTSDMSAFTAFLNQIDVETISSGATSLDKAVSATLTAFEHVPTQKSKLLIIVTDGEDFSTSLASVKKQAQEQQLHLFALGIGSPEGAPIPLFDPLGSPMGHQKDDVGTIVISQLNETGLRSLTHDLGGEYIRITNDDTDVALLAKKIQSFEKEAMGNATIKRFEEQYPFFAIVSFLCFLLEWLL